MKETQNSYSKNLILHYLRKKDNFNKSKHDNEYKVDQGIKSTDLFITYLPSPQNTFLKRSSGMYHPKFLPRCLQPSDMLTQFETRLKIDTPLLSNRNTKIKKITYPLTQFVHFHCIV